MFPRPRTHSGLSCSRSSGSSGGSVAPDAGVRARWLCALRQRLWPWWAQQWLPGGHHPRPRTPATISLLAMTAP